MKAKSTEAQVLMDRTERASREALEIFEKTMAQMENRKRSMAAFDYVLIAKLATQFIGFGFFTMKTAHGLEGAERWLHMTLSFVEDELKVWRKC